MFSSLRKKPVILLGVALIIILVISVIKVESSKTNVASKAESEEVAEAETSESPANEEETKKDATTDVEQKVNQEPTVVQAEEKVEKDAAPVNKEESTKQSTKEQTITANNKAVQATSQAKGNASSKKDDFSGIDTFWRSFRNAVLSNNMSEVKRMTQLPVSTRGPMDTDPIIKINEDKFDKIFQNFLNQDDGLDGNSILGYIRNAENLSFKNSVDYDNSREHIKTIRVDNNGAGISSMAFRLINGEWKLILIYYKIN